MKQSRRDNGDWKPQAGIPVSGFLSELFCLGKKEAAFLRSSIVGI